MEKTYLGWTWPEWKRILHHSPFGIIVLLFPLLPVSPCVVAAGMIIWAGFFGLYQLIQEWNRRGNSHVDVAGAIFGMAPGAVILYLVKTFGG